MINSRRHVLAALVVAASLALTACGGTATPAGSASASGSAAKTYKIGISQYVSHDSLDASRTGFKKALSDAGIKVTYDEQNSQADQATATSIANKFKNDKVDLVLAIATPTALATSQVITDLPILFTAVTDPVVSKLVTSAAAPGGNVTGTTDMNPVAEQIALIKQLRPEAKSVGIISSGEVNSEIQVKLAVEAAAKEGLQVVQRKVSNTNDVAAAAAGLTVDAFYIPTDNIVVSAIASVLQVAEQKKLPVVAGEGDSVRKGAVITYGIDYEKLGYQTGQMAVKILTQGAKPASMPVESQKDLKMVINTAAAARMGVTVPASLLAKADEVIK